MRKTKTCPKCSGKKLLDIAMVPDEDDGDHPAPARIAVRHEGFSYMGNEKRRTVGDLQAIVCSDCGYTEYYCANPKAIEPDGKFIRWL